MGLFSKLANLAGNNDSNSNSGDQPIIFQFNAESETVMSSAVNGRSIAQIFQNLFGAENQVRSFMAAGSIVSGDEIPRPGIIYRANTTTDDKGASHNG